MAKKKKNRDKNDYSQDVVCRKRTFPKKNVVIITFVAMIQIAVIFYAVWYTPAPQDIIENYEITVNPNSDGTLNIEYSFVWTAMDQNEDLTWVKIGAANNEYTIYEESCSGRIAKISKDCDDYGNSFVRIDFDRAYKGGETLEFSYKLRQNAMLCSDEDGMFYEFIPGWFNSTPVKSYAFRWASADAVASDYDSVQNGYYVWQGEIRCGEYAKMTVGYPKNYFKNAQIIDYAPFDSEGVYDELESNKQFVRFICILLVLGGGIVEIIIIDSFVSYNRGRGFINRYGYPVHVYGRTNPKYIRARDGSRISSHHSRGYRSGGCACACACACAGGGRAGCSQKDTYKNGGQKVTK